jgi:hypothetical protein
MVKPAALKWAGAVPLLAALLFFDRLLLPAHLTSIWMDLEFTDWISPIANQLHDGARLYADGLHIPMPPLPYLLVHWLHPDGAIWIQENLLYLTFQGATILLLYFLMALSVGPGLSLAACLATLPLFLSLTKSILYDSMAQFFVAVAGGLCAALIRSLNSGRSPSAHDQAPSWDALLGVALGLLMLCKQSTDLGAFLGVGVAVIFLPGGVRFNQRCLHLVVVAAFAAGTICLVALAASAYVSFPGLIRDVFLTSAEPKGGPRKLAINFARYAWYVAKVMGGAAILFYATSWFARRRTPKTTQTANLQTILGWSPAAHSLSLAAQAQTIVLALAVSGACILAVVTLPDHGVIKSGLAAIWDSGAQDGVLNVGLAAALALALGALWQGWRGKAGTFALHPLAPYALVFFGAAVFHSLSVPTFRWTYDNNPLITLALVFVLSPTLTEPGEIPPRPLTRTRAVFFCAAVVLMWCNFLPNFKSVVACTETWPEISQLAGARLRPESDGMRRLVKIVRSQTDPVQGDTVLLLPDDPNVEAWFDRPRPALSSAIIFADQYWDRYVDRDFATLAAHPPKVIVIGPRNFWRLFSRSWHWYKDEGALRLIDRVQNELLPANYDLRYQQPITLGSRPDFMDVYVRRN